VASEDSEQKGFINPEPQFTGNSPLKGLCPKSNLRAPNPIPKGLRETPKLCETPSAGKKIPKRPENLPKRE